MNELTFISHGDVFTNSWIIAENIGRDHASVTYNIRKFRKRFENTGTLSSATRKSTGGRPAHVYDLNEAQAVFLMTLMDNTERVLDFKQALAMEFVRMRRFLLERNTAEWQQARLESKDCRKIVSDTIKELVPYAIEQGSTHPNKLYEAYAKLIKGLLGYESLDATNTEMLSTVSMLCRVLRGILLQEMAKDIYYKIIFQTAKTRLTELVALMNTPRLTA